MSLVLGAVELYRSVPCSSDLESSWPLCFQILFCPSHSLLETTQMSLGCLECHPAQWRPVQCLSCFLCLFSVGVFVAVSQPLLFCAVCCTRRLCLRTHHSTCCSFNFSRSVIWVLFRACVGLWLPGCADCPRPCPRAVLCVTSAWPVFLPVADHFPALLHVGEF